MVIVYRFMHACKPASSQAVHKYVTDDPLDSSFKQLDSSSLNIRV